MSEAHSESIETKSREFPYLAFVVLYALIILLPVFIFRVPFSALTPDVLYVKAKILRILNGELFADPITGFPNFHPPYYHLVLSVFVRLGLSIDTVLVSISVVNVIGLFVTVYFIIKEHFGIVVALLVTALLPFIVNYMGCGNMFLPTAFFFSLPIFLTGLWLYTKKNRRGGTIVISGLLWGIAFSVSPMYLFPVGFTLVADGIRLRKVKPFALAAGGLAVGLIPFLVQAYVVISYGFFGTGAFSFWRGIPDLAFWKNVGRLFLTPLDQSFADPLVWPAILALFGGIAALFKTKGPRWLALAMLASYLFTQYNYVPQYAIRVQFLLSLFLTAFALKFLLELPLRRHVVIVVAGLLAVLGTYNAFDIHLRLYKKQQELLAEYHRVGDKLQAALPHFVDPDEYLLVKSNTYLLYVMPVVLAHALVAYWSGEYFQLAEKVSDEYQEDYNSLLRCETLDCLDYFCGKYSMKTAVVHGGDELRIPAFRLVDHFWQMVYSDDQFRIYKRPGPN